MNPLAYLIIHSVGIPFALAVVLNLLIELVIVAIVIYLIVWVLQQCGIPVPLTIVRLLGVLVVLLIIASLFSGCSTSTGNPSKDKAGAVTNAVLQDVFNNVLNAGLTTGADALEGQNGQDAAQAAFIAAGEKSGIDALGTILKAYAGPQIAPVADAAAKAFASANPQTPAQKVSVLNTIGAAIQTAANQLFNVGP